MDMDHLPETDAALRTMTAITATLTAAGPHPSLKDKGRKETAISRMIAFVISHIVFRSIRDGFTG